MARRGRAPERSPEPITAGGEWVGDRQQRPMVAAALNVDLADRRVRRRIKGTRTDQEWQKEAWDHFDSIPIVGFAGDFIANAMSRLRFYIGWAALPSDTPTEVDPDNPPDGMDMKAYLAAAEILDRLNTGMGLMEMSRKAAYNLTLPGEMWVIGRLDENGDERFDAYSPSEFDPLREKGGKYEIRTTPAPDVEGITIDPADPNVITIRVWRPHPQWGDLAVTPMKRLLEVCEELRLIRRYFRDATRSRLNAGILEVPEEWGFSAERNKNDEHPKGIDKMSDLLIKAMTTALDDETSAAAVIPILVHASAETLGKMKFTTFERPYDAVAQEQRSVLAGEIAGGIDLPDQVLLGLGQVKFRNAEVITDEQFKLHLEPLAIVWVRSLSTGFMYGAMDLDYGIDPKIARQFTVWYDPAAVTSDPDRSASSNFGYLNNLLGGAAWRAYNGYTDDDAPTPEELAERAAKAMAAQQAVADQAAGATANDQQGPQEKVDEANTPFGLAASGHADRLARLGPRMARAELAVRLKLQGMADQAMRRAFERIGNAARSKPAVKGELRLTPARSVVSHLGVERLVGLGVDPDAIIVEELAKLEARYGEVVANHIGSLVGQIAKSAGTSPDVLLAALGDRPAQALAHSWQTLEADLRALAGDEMFQAMVAQSTARGVEALAEFADVAGEFDPSVAVPAGLIRKALSYAGGSTSPTPTYPPSLGGVVNGPLLGDALDEAGLDQDGYEWMYGDAGTRIHPFEPHEALDGVIFSDYEDPQLANPLDWPGPQLYIGDHPYCQCEQAPRIIERERTGPVDPVAPSTLRERGLDEAPADEAAFAKSAFASSR